MWGISITDHRKLSKYIIQSLGSRGRGGCRKQNYKQQIRLKPDPQETSPPYSIFPPGMMGSGGQATLLDDTMDSEMQQGVPCQGDAFWATVSAYLGMQGAVAFDVFMSAADDDAFQIWLRNDYAELR